MRLLTAEDVTFEIEIEDEGFTPRGQFASGDEADRQLENEIIKRLDRGDLWAWCCVRVIARWNGFEGDVYLGGCSYADEDDFKADGGYYPQLCDEALENLNAEIKRTCERIAPLCNARGL
jgi:hypothetical protein